MHNNMFKKALSLVLAAALIVGVCSGCSKKPDDTPEVTEKPRQAVLSKATRCIGTWSRPIYIITA